MSASQKHELALGITLMILVTISGQEIAHLVSPWAALAVMMLSLVGALWAYKRA